MSPMRLIFLLPFVLAVAACSKNQPSGVPDVASSPPPAATAAPNEPQVPPPAAAAADPAVPIAAVPPPLDDQIPPYEKTGFPDCDEYVESYRQCLNTRLGDDERKAKAGELGESVRAILGNIGRGVDPGRVAKQCQKSRRLAAQKLAALGCPL